MWNQVGSQIGGLGNQVGSQIGGFGNLVERTQVTLNLPSMNQIIQTWFIDGKFNIDELIY